MTDRPHHNGVYRHYKGDLYTVVGECVHHDTRVPMVLYRSHKLGIVNARPLHGTASDPDGWLVPVDGKPRFEFTGEFEMRGVRDTLMRLLRQDPQPPASHICEVIEAEVLALRAELEQAKGAVLYHKCLELKRTIARVRMGFGELAEKWREREPCDGFGPMGATGRKVAGMCADDLDNMLELALESP